jgi:hypothetical protein
MINTNCYDLFLTHAWRFHDDWTKFSEFLDKAPGVKWRNFSLPWHDPAMNPNSKIGGQFIRDNLEAQIIPVHAVVLLAGVYSIASARRWFDLEVEIAIKHNKPMVGIGAFGETSIPDEVSDLCDICCSWDAEQVFKSIDQIKKLSKFSEF